MVLVSAIYQCESVINIHMSPPFEPSSQLSPHPTPLGCHRVPGWTPGVIKQLPVS